MPFFRVTCQLSQDHKPVEIEERLKNTKYKVLPYEDVIFAITDINTNRWTEDNVGRAIEEDLFNLGLTCDFTKVLRVQ